MEQYNFVLRKCVVTASWYPHIDSLVAYKHTPDLVTHDYTIPIDVHKMIVAYFYNRAFVELTLQEYLVAIFGEL